MRIGILTGGGDCPGLNAVIRAVVRTAVHKYGWEVLGILHAFQGLVTPLQTRPLTPANTRGILQTGGTILGTTSQFNPLRYVPPEGADEPQDLSPQIAANVRELGLDGLIVVGGDGTLAVAHQLVKLGVPIVGVPKTIDNDIRGTDFPFGFHTAVVTATDALDKLHTTAESHHRVIVMEVMGRYVGWIALTAGIAGGADVILIPEIPYDIAKVCKKIQQRSESGNSFSIVVAAEGATPLGGERTVQRVEDRERGVFERLGGVGHKVGEQIGMCIWMEVRVTVLGHLQRGGSPTAFDRVLATRFGASAVDLIAAGGLGRMVTLRGTRIDSIPLEDAVSGLKTVPPDSDLIQTAEGLGISFGR